MSVIGGVIANDVDEGHSRASGVVQIRKTVSKTGAEVQQRTSRFAGHACVSVCRAGNDAFEQTQHAAHAVLLVERCDEVHFRRAGIGETDFHTASNQGLQQTFRTVHV